LNATSLSDDARYGCAEHDIEQRLHSCCSDGELAGVVFGNVLAGIDLIIHSPHRFVLETGRRSMHKVISIYFTLGACILTLNLHAQVITTYSMDTPGTSKLIGSNSISDIGLDGDTVWTATGRGLSLTSDEGLNWINLTNMALLNNQSATTLTIRGNDIWTAASFTIMQDNIAYPAGGGLRYSTNKGASWTSVPQPTDKGTVDTLMYGHNRIPTLDIPVLEGNVTFGIGLTSDAVWIASWYGMLRTSTDHGTTWTRVVLPPDSLNSIAPSDTLSFNMSNSQGRLKLGQNRNHFVFAVHVSSDSLLWVGTAGGVNKSTDGGVSWRKFNHRNQPQAICGDYVVAIKEQQFSSRTIIWAVCNTGDEPDEKRGVSYSSNEGETWRSILFSDFVRDVTFKDSIIYIATDGGLYRTSDMGTSFIKAGTVYDPISGQQWTQSEVDAVEAKGDTLWVGGADGLAYTIDSRSESFGSRWKIFRTYQPVATAARTYSYPLPFSPANEAVRLHYSTQDRTATVTIRVFDFAMHPVKTLVQNAMRSGNVEHDEIWNGRNELGQYVANGVYFYRVEIEGRDPAWGKIMVVQ
jgi:hypothetical protein